MIHLKPMSLYAFALNETNVYVGRVIASILDTDGYGNCSSDNKLELLHKYLCSHLHPHIIDDLLGTVDVQLHSSDSEKLMFLKVLMHRNMMKFQPKFKLPSSDHFYEERLVGLRRLVALNLRMVCTDEILEVVGRNCPSLEFIDIVSKIGTIKPRNELNALKLKYFVSDEGLKHLHSCALLKRIIMRKVIGSNCGGRKVTYNGIRELLTVLDKLQYIRYNDMGFVLEGLASKKKLNLVHLHDDHVNPNHVENFAKHCPRLKGLCLMVPPVVIDGVMPENCMERLAYSQLNLESIGLKGFPDGPSFSLYLQLKGVHLLRLAISHTQQLSIETIIKIGERCPNLKYFEFHTRKLEHFHILQRNNSSFNENPFFQRLENLKIIGTDWDPNVIFSICIYNSPRLKQIVLVNKEYFRPSDWILSSLSVKNNLNFLQDFACYGFNFSIESLFQFLVKYRTLRSIEIRGENDYDDYLDDIKAQNNFQFEIVHNITKVYGGCFCID